MAAAHELQVEQAATPPNATPRGSENPAYSPEPELDSAAVRAQATQRKTAAEAKCSTNPQKQRHSCTDVLCALLLLAALALELGVVGLAFALGEPALLLYPRDSSDKLCGYDADVADKPNLAFFDLMQCAQAGGAAFLANCPTTPKVCVASCPSAYWSFISGTAAEAISTNGTPRHLFAATPTLFPLFLRLLVCGLTCGGRNDRQRRTTINERVSRVEFTLFFLPAGLGYSVEQRSQMLCKYGVNAYVNMSIYELVNSGQCASYTLESEPLYGRCVPRALSLIKSEIDKAIANRTSSNESISAVVINEAITRLSDAVRQLQPLVSDLVASKWVFACGLVLALALALLWLLLLRFFAAVIVWTLLVAFVLIFAASSAYSFYRYALLRDASQNVSITSTTLSDSFSFSAALSTLDYYMSQSSTWLVLAIVAGVCALVALLIVLFLRKRVVLATRLIEEASRAIGAVWTALLWPLVPFVLVVVAVLFFLTAGVFIASIRNGQKYTNSSANASLLQQCSVSGVASVSGAAEASSCVLQTTFGTWWTTVLLVYNAFMGFWVVNFVHGLGQMTLAGAFSAYYWAPGNPKEMPAFPLGSALFNSLFYHGGSIAFGALLIAIVQVIRLVLSYVKRRLAKKKNPVPHSLHNSCSVSVHLQGFFNPPTPQFWTPPRNTAEKTQWSGPGGREVAEYNTNLHFETNNYFKKY